jgi:hypothetical protein
MCCVVRLNPQPLAVLAAAPIAAVQNQSRETFE